jgi:hypothetical protein
MLHFSCCDDARVCFLERLLVTRLKVLGRKKSKMKSLILF